MIGSTRVRSTRNFLFPSFPSLRSWRFVGGAGSGEWLLNFLLPIPLAASLLVFAAPSLKTPTKPPDTQARVSLLLQNIIFRFVEILARSRSRVLARAYLGASHTVVCLCVCFWGLHWDLDKSLYSFDSHFHAKTFYADYNSTSSETYMY